MATHPELQQPMQQLQVQMQQMMHAAQVVESRIRQTEVQLAAAAAARPVDLQRTELVKRGCSEQAEELQLGAGREGRMSRQASGVPWRVGRSPFKRARRSRSPAAADVLSLKLLVDAQEASRKLYYIFALLLDG